MEKQGKSQNRIKCPEAEWNSEVLSDIVVQKSNVHFPLQKIWRQYVLKNTSQGQSMTCAKSGVSLSCVLLACWGKLCCVSFIAVSLAN